MFIQLFRDLGYEVVLGILFGAPDFDIASIQTVLFFGEDGFGGVRKPT
jgi:hypothetical protein